MSAATLRHSLSRILGALLIALASASCGQEPETVLSLDVTLPAGVTARRLEVDIGDQVQRSYAGALPEPGRPLGLDMRLPRTIAGVQSVSVRALDGARCLVAEKTLTVTLVPGQHVPGGDVLLVALDAAICGTAPDGGTIEDAPSPVEDTATEDDATPGPTVDTVPPAEVNATPDTNNPPTDANSPPSDGGAADGRPADTSAPVDTRPPDVSRPDVAEQPRTCSNAGQCRGGENCLSGTCRPAAASCADVAAQQANAPDGVYVLKIGAKTEAAYCDMRLKRVLCAVTPGEYRGRTRDASALPFILKSALELPDLCRVWGVRHEQDGHPLDMLVGVATTAGSPVKSTCEALGFRGEASLVRTCYYGSLQHCGFNVPIRPGPGGRHVAKWGNTCDCNPKRLQPFYTFEIGVHVSHIPWDMSGAHHAKCRIR